MNNSIFIFFFIIVLSQINLGFAQEVDQGQQATTIKNVEFRNSDSEPKPSVPISRETSLKLVLTGFKAAASLTPHGIIINRAVDISEVLIEVPVKSVNHNNDLMKGELLLLTADAKRLKQIHQSGRKLKEDSEAQKILYRANLYPNEELDDYTFARRAIFSSFGLYILATESGFTFLQNFFGERIAKWMGLGEKAKLIWKENLKPSSVARVHWHKIKFIDKYIAKYIKSLNDELFQIKMEKAMNSEYDRLLAARVEEILFGRPVSQIRRYNHVTNLRLNIMDAPAIAMPLLLQSAVRPVIVLPVSVVQYKDPVVNAIATEYQIINAQHYQVQSNQGTYREKEVSHPMKDLPNKINIGGSFDGNGIDIWH